MDIIELIFHLGVLFAIFGFLWGALDLLVRMFSGRTKTLSETYVSKGIQYVLLSNVTFLFCLDNNFELDVRQSVITGALLLMYFIGKLQRNQNRIKLFSSSFGKSDFLPSNFNLRLEIIVISVAILAFGVFFFAPNFAKNIIALWFHASSMQLEKAFLFGFIFKIIGFFFLLTILMKLINGIFYMLSGRPIVEITSAFQSTRKKKEDSEFDDFEEL